MRVVLAALAMAGFALVLFLQQQRVDRLRAENLELRNQLTEAAATRASAKAEPAPATDTALTQQQRTELLRLRGEVTRLRNEARGAAAAPAGAGASSASDQPAAGLAPFVAAATANVANGESFATGGWLTAPGFRTFLLATPSLGKNDSGVTGVNIAMCLLKIPEGEVPETLLQKLDRPSPAEPPVFTGTDVAFFTDLAASGESSHILSRPRIATSDGETARLFIGENRPNPDGTQRQIGTTIQVSPEVAADGQTIRMAINLEYTPPDEKPLKP